MDKSYLFMQFLIRYIMPLSVLLFPFLLNAQTKNTPTYQYKYLKEIKSEFSVNIYDNLIDALLVFDIPRLATYDHTSDISVVYTLINQDGQIIETDSLENERVFCFKKNLNWHFPLKINYPKEKKPHALTVTLYDHPTAQKVRHTYEFKPTLSPLDNSVQLVIKQNPTKNKYSVKVGDTIRIASKTDKRVFLYRFQHSFSPAFPPMLVGATENINPQYDSLLIVRTNQPLVLHKTGLYFLQEDTTAQVGLPILVTPEDFPKYRKIHRVIEPLVYISSQREMTEFYNTDDKKKTLDTYWITLGGNPDNAKALIKTYYNRVAYANKYFSGYKEGWKTDQGIVYIIFGEPTQILSYDNKDVWVYSKNSYHQEIRFEFYKKHTLFCDNCYELARKTDYKEDWYNAVDRWRAGFINKE